MASTTEYVCLATHRHDPQRPRKAADGLRLCYGCVEGMRRHLDELPALYAEVVTSMTATRTSGGAPVSGTREPGLPINLPAGELRSQIEYDLYYWAQTVATDRGMQLPASGRVASVCAWLGKHVDWLAAQQCAPDVRAVLAELTGHAYRVIDPNRPALVLGPCVETIDGEPCDGTLRATVLDIDDPRPSRIWCDTCPLELTSAQWYRFGKRYKERLATAQQQEPARMAG